MGKNALVRVALFSALPFRASRSCKVSRGVCHSDPYRLGVVGYICIPCILNFILSTSDLEYHIIHSCCIIPVISILGCNHCRDAS